MKERHSDSLLFLLLIWSPREFPRFEAFPGHSPPKWSPQSPEVVITSLWRDFSSLISDHKIWHSCLASQVKICAQDEKFIFLLQDLSGKTLINMNIDVRCPVFPMVPGHLFDIRNPIFDGRNLSRERSNIIWNDCIGLHSHSLRISEWCKARNIFILTIIHSIIGQRRGREGRGQEDNEIWSMDRGSSVWQSWKIFLNWPVSDLRLACKLTIQELKCKNLSLQDCKDAGAGGGSVEETKAGPVNRRHHRPGPLFRERRQAN